MNPYPPNLPIRGIMINAHPNDYQNLPIYPHNELILIDITPSVIPLRVRITKQRGSVIYLRDIISGLNKMYGGYRFSMRMVGGAPKLRGFLHTYGIQRVVGRELAPKNVMSAWKYGVING